MKKYNSLVFIITLFILPAVLAADLEVEKIANVPVIITEIDNPANFTFKIKNNDVTDRFELYSLVSVDIEPRNLQIISSGETRESEVLIYPHDSIIENIRGLFVFEYEIKGQKSGYFRDRLTIDIVELKNAFAFAFENISPTRDSVSLSIKNLKNFNFKQVKIDASSPFFEYSETIEINPFETVSISIPIKKEEIDNFIAGLYNSQIILEVAEADAKAVFNEKVNYLEKDSVSVSTSFQGVIIKKETNSKTNEGNVPTLVEITTRKDIISRLFTTNSPAPISSHREGFFINYKWEETIGPQETFTVISTTNYTMPFVILIIIILIVISATFYLSSSLSLEKRVSFIKTKGGEFALKVKINAKARRRIKELNIIDIIPAIMKFYEKFGKKPDKVDERERKLSWNIGNMESGEERILSYIIYSKIRVIGKIELPSALGIFKKDDKVQRVYSNKTFFAAESFARENQDED